MNTRITKAIKFNRGILEYLIVIKNIKLLSVLCLLSIVTELGLRFSEPGGVDGQNSL